MGGTREVWIAASALSAVLAAHAQGAAAAERAGVAAMVRASATTNRPGQAPLRLNVGDPVFQDQRIATGPRSHVQVMLLDRSTLTVAPDSEVWINEFAYDTEQRTGRMLIEGAKGLFRFVGGLISKRTPVRMRMGGTATIGIRGAVVVVEAKPGGGFRLVFLYGIEATVQTGDGRELRVNEPGFMIETGSADGNDAVVSPVPEDMLASMLQRLEGPPLDQAPVATVSDAAVALLQERLAQDPNVTIEQMERILGIQLQQSIDQAREGLEQARERLERLDVPVATGSGGGGPMM